MVENKHIENYEYYTSAENKIVGKRDYFEFHEDSMFNRIAQNKRKKNNIGGQKSPTQYRSDNRTDESEDPYLIKKAQQDFLENKSTFSVYNDDHESAWEGSLNAGSDDNFISAEQPLFSDNDFNSEFIENTGNTEKYKYYNYEISGAADWFIDGIDEFKDDLQGYDFNDVETDGKITHEARANQIAEITCEMIRWGERHEVELLAQIFSESGWSLTRNRLLKEIRAGMTYDMVELAVKIRELWNSHDEFTLGYYRGWVAGMHTNVTWSFCHDLINSYGSLPDEDEIESYLLEMFDSWYHADEIKKHYLTFYDYIKFRTKSNIPFEMAPIIPYQKTNKDKFSFHHIGNFGHFLEFK